MFYSLHAYKDLGGHSKKQHVARSYHDEQTPRFLLDSTPLTAGGAMNSHHPQTTVGALLRGIAWMADVAAIVVLGYVAHAWPANAGVVASGLIAVS